MMNEKKYIGIFDSGIGGLTVVNHLLKQNPNENIVYLADSKHMPYGDKSNDEIISYVLDDVKFLNNYNLKAILIACNTADSVASKSIKDKYSNIPVYGVIDATAKVAATTTSNNKIGVIATLAAINTNEYEKHILKTNPKITVYNKACPFLAPLIEEGNFDIANQEIRFILKDYISPLLDKGIDTLVLGCTHYDLLIPIIEDMYPNLKLVSSSRCVIDVIEKEVEPNNSSNYEQLYFASSNPEKFEEVASMFMNSIKVKEI